jgi:hypothetical protein
MLAVATPLLLVVAVVTFVPVLANVPLAPLPGPLKVTVRPATRTGFPPLSSTVALMRVPNGVPTVVVCPTPPVTATLAAAVTLVSRKVVAVKVVDDGTTTYGPVVALAVKVLEVATPAVFVKAAIAIVPPVKVPLAPLAGAVNVTEVLAMRTGFPWESSIVAARGLVNAVPTEAF